MVKTIILLLFFPAIVFSQVNTISDEAAIELRKITTKALIERDNLDAITYKKVTDLILTDRLNSYLDTVDIKENLILSNKEQIINAFKDIYGEFGHPYSEATFYSDNHAVETIDYYSDTKALVFHTLMFGSTFNSYNLKSMERCIRISTSVVLPFFSLISRNFDDSQYIGTVVTYRFRNFLDDSDRDQHDILIVIVDAKTAKDFYNLKISESEMVSKCDFYLKDGQSFHSSLKKIELR